jgi:hypothetical protein
MRLLTFGCQTKTADAEKTCSAVGGQKKKSWASFRWFRAKKSMKHIVDAKQAETAEKFELESRIMKWLSESSREEILQHELDIIYASKKIKPIDAPEDTGTSLCQSTVMDGNNSNSEESSSKKMDRKVKMPSSTEELQPPPGVSFRSDRPACLVAPRQDILRPCNVHSGLLRLGGLEGKLNLPSGLGTNGGLALAESFRSLAAPLCGGAR